MQGDINVKVALTQSKTISEGYCYNLLRKNYAVNTVLYDVVYGSNCCLTLYKDSGNDLTSSFFLIFNLTHSLP